MTDCQLGVIKPRLLNSEKRKATSLLLLDLNITLGLQESIAFKSSKVIRALKISTSLIQSTNNAICLSFKIELNGFSVSATCILNWLQFFLFLLELHFRLYLTFFLLSQVF